MAQSRAALRHARARSREVQRAGRGSGVNAATMAALMNVHRLVFICSVLLTLVGRADRLVLVAGGGAKEDDAPAAETKLIAPFGVDFDAAGNLYLVEMAGGERVRKMGGDGVLHIIAGTGAKGFAGDGGLGREAQFNGMHNLAALPNGDLFLADTWNQRSRHLDANS